MIKNNKQCVGNILFKIKYDRIDGRYVDIYNTQLNVGL